MQLNMNEVVLVARLLKGATHEDKEPKKPKKDKKRSGKQNKPTLTGAYPDYSRSIVSQQRRDPTTAGIQRGAGAGITGAVLGAMLARILSKDPRATAGGAIAGGLAGGIPGFISGSEEAKSDYTKLLALRRLGIQTPGEYEQSMTFPALADRITSPGVRV